MQIMKKKNTLDVVLLSYFLLGDPSIIPFNTHPQSFFIPLSNSFFSPQQLSPQVEFNIGNFLFQLPLNYTWSGLCDFLVQIVGGVTVLILVNFHFFDILD